MTIPTSHIQSEARSPAENSSSGCKIGLAKSLGCASAGVALVLTLALGPPLHNQARAQPTPEPVCLASTGSAEPITVIVPKSREADVMGQGFVSASCNDAPDVATYRSQICGLAQGASDELKSAFTAAYRIRSETLCTYAQEIG